MTEKTEYILRRIVERITLKGGIVTLMGGHVKSVDGQPVTILVNHECGDPSRRVRAHVTSERVSGKSWVESRGGRIRYAEIVREALRIARVLRGERRRVGPKKQTERILAPVLAEFDQPSGVRVAVRGDGSVRLLFDSLTAEQAKSLLGSCLEIGIG